MTVMRTSLVMICLFAGSAYADPEIVGPSDVAPSHSVFARDSHAQPAGMWLDFGAGAASVAPGDGNVYKGSFVRFAPQATINRVFYLGAEINIGSFDTSTPASASSARGVGVDTPMSSGVDGTVGAVSAVAGARAMAGIFSGAVELAGGVRYTTVRVSNSFNTETQGVVEARGRVDLWVTPHLSIGGIVGKDLNDTQSMMVGLNVGLHFERFDHSR
jgi:hypothetical protein